MVKISEEVFVKAFETIKAGYDKRTKFEKAITEVSDSFFICNIGEEWLEGMIGLLEEVMNDHPTSKYDSMISWWLFEDVDKKIWWEEHGREVELDLTTPQALYKYLAEKAID